MDTEQRGKDTTEDTTMKQLFNEPTGRLKRLSPGTIDAPRDQGETRNRGAPDECGITLQLRPFQHVPAKCRSPGQRKTQRENRPKEEMQVGILRHSHRSHQVLQRVKKEISWVLTSVLRFAEQQKDQPTTRVIRLLGRIRTSRQLTPQSKKKGDQSVSLEWYFRFTIQKGSQTTTFWATPTNFLGPASNRLFYLYLFIQYFTYFTLQLLLLL